MGTKLPWTGLTFISAAVILSAIPAVTIVGAVIMVLGLVLLWMGR